VTHTAPSAVSIQAVHHRKISRGGLFAVAVVLLVSAFLLFYHLGSEPLQDYDEATYAEVSTEAIASHSYVALTFMDKAYFKKPPVLFWLMDVSESLVPNPEVAARLPGTLSGLLLIGLVIFFAYEATQNEYAGAAAGAILATTSAFIESARQARFDILVTFFIIASVYAFFRAISTGKRIWYFWFGILLGMTFLTKGPLAAYAVVSVLAIALAYKSYKWFFDPYFWAGVAGFFVVVVPWHLYETFRFGTAFWEEYLGDEIVNRVGETLFTGPTNGEYLTYLFSFALPWSMVFCGSLVVLALFWKWMTPKARGLSAASGIGVAIVLIVCFVTKTKAVTYLIPLYPFMALAIAIAGYELVSKMKPAGVKALLGVGFLILAEYGLEISIYNGFHINPYYSTEVVLAQNEKPIGEMLLADHASTFYVDDVTTLGSIMYYSRILAPGGFSVGMKVPQDSYVIFPPAYLSQFQKGTPGGFNVLYQGPYIDLGQVDVQK
jgi:4-amino-4-deoxy-L-arabinose transferase-like glycosyltransferase